MIFSKKMLGSCCVGLALLLSGESFGMRSVGDLGVKCKGGVKQLAGTLVADAYNTLVESNAFRNCGVGDQALAVLAVALIDGGFCDENLEGYDKRNKDGIVGLIGSGALSRYLAYYDEGFQLADKVEDMIKAVGEKRSEGEGRGAPGDKGGALLFRLFGGAPAAPTSTGMKSSGLQSLFGKGVGQDKASSGGAIPPRSRTPGTNYNLGKEAFEESAKKRLAPILPQDWDKKVTLNGTVDSGVVEILFGGKRFLTTVSALDAARRHFVDEGVKPDAEAFVSLVKLFIAQDAALAKADAELAKADAALQKERSNNMDAIKGEAAVLAKQYAAYFHELQQKGRVVECSLTNDDPAASAAYFSVYVPDVTSKGLEFEAFKVDADERITNPVNGDNIGFYNKTKYGVHKTTLDADVAKLDAGSHALYDMSSEDKYVRNGHEVIDTSTHTKVAIAHAEAAEKLEKGGHEVVNTAHKDAVLAREKKLAEVEGLKESNTAVLGIGSGGAVFGNGKNVQKLAQDEVDALMTEITKVLQVFGAIDLSKLEADDITVLNSIATKLLSGNWSNIDDDTSGVKDAALKGILDTAKTLVADNVNDGAVANLITAEFGSLPGVAIDANGVRKALLIAALAGKDADAIKNSIGN